MATSAAGRERSQLTLADDGTVVIERHGFFAGQRQGRRSVTPVADITAVHLKPPRLGVPGFIQLLVGGEGEASWTGNNTNRRAMYFDSGQHDQVEEVAARIRALVSAAAANNNGTPHAGATAPVIMVVSSNPHIDPAKPRLALDEEENRIRDALESSPHGRRFRLELRPAARVDELLGDLLEQRPTVLHLSGHGLVEGLVGTDDAGNPVLINPVGLARMLALNDVAANLRVLVLNVCLSVEQAKLLAEGVPFVIGTVAKVKDGAAISFAHGLYTALGNGQSAGDAFDAGAAQAELLMPGASQLYTWASAVDPHGLALLA